MGAWGPGTFDNDEACDWAYGLDACNDLSLVDQALSDALNAGAEYLDASVASQALAAAEAVARLKGNFGARNAYTGTVDKWVATHPFKPPADLVARALAVIDRVVAEPSELLDLWTDSDDAPAWREAVADLRRRAAG